VDSLSGELNAASLALRQLEGRSKGSAFAYEMKLDTHRYGALIVIDRWSTLAAAFAAHLQLPKRQTMLAEAGSRARAAEQLLGRVNQVIDASGAYSTEIVEAALFAFQSAAGVFEEERTDAEESAKLGPMLPADYREARGIFLEDLAAR
jgi:hypothetical protein